MLDTLDKYLYRRFLELFLLVLLLLSALYVGIDLMTRFWSLELPFLSVLMIYAYKLPSVIQMFFPVAVLLTTLVVLTNLSKQNELLALYSTGYSKLRITGSIFALVALLSAASFVVFDSVVPFSLRRAQSIERKESPELEKITGGIPNIWYRNRDYIYRFASFDPGIATMTGIDIFKINSEFQITERHRAASATYVEDEWLLNEGYSINYPPNLFPKNVRFTALSGVKLERPMDLRNVRFDEKTLKMRDLRLSIRRNKNFGIDSIGQQVTLHERISLAFTPLLFVLLAATLALEPLRTANLGKNVTICFSIVFLYLLLMRVTVSMGKNGLYHPILAGWTPNLAVLSFALFRSMRRV